MRPFQDRNLLMLVWQMACQISRRKGRLLYIAIRHSICWLLKAAKLLSKCIGTRSKEAELWNMFYNWISLNISRLTGFHILAYGVSNTIQATSEQCSRESIPTVGGLSVSCLPVISTKFAWCREGLLYHPFMHNPSSHDVLCYCTTPVNRTKSDIASKKLLQCQANASGINAILKQSKLKLEPSGKINSRLWPY